MIDYYQHLRDLSRKVGSGAEVVGVDYQQNNPVLDMGHVPSGLRQNWAGFLMDIGMGMSFYEDLYPGLKVSWARLEGSAGVFELADGLYSQKYQSPLLGDTVIPNSEVLESMEWVRITGLNGNFPTGICDEIRGKFPHGRPSGFNLFLYEPE